jgi:hypothetical protein
LVARATHSVATTALIATTTATADVVAMAAKERICTVGIDDTSISTNTNTGTNTDTDTDTDTGTGTSNGTGTDTCAGSSTATPKLEPFEPMVTADHRTEHSLNPRQFGERRRSHHRHSNGCPTLHTVSHCSALTHNPLAQVFLGENEMKRCTTELNLRLSLGAEHINISFGNTAIGARLCCRC